MFTVTGVERESPSVSRTAQRFVMAQKVFEKGKSEPTLQLLITYELKFQ